MRGWAMHLSYLVDGYNVVFALGLLDRRAGARALERARRRLLDDLHDGLAAPGHEITVVFDSRRGMPGSRSGFEYRGIRVCFARAGDVADDVIERLIAADADPRRLVVISNDHRVQEAARHRGARPWSCAELLDHFLDHPDRPCPMPPPGAAPGMSREEVRRWLEEFGDLADDPGFRELFEPYPFEDDAGL